MIEVERNFEITPNQKEQLIKQAEFIKTKTFTDVYYDNNYYDLTRKDFWLRTRDHRFELKIPLNGSGIKRGVAEKGATDIYRELETDKEIIDELGLEIKSNLEAALTEIGYKPFATITTKREYYRKGDFNLDFDEVKEINFTTFEIELMVNSREEIPKAEARIWEFAKQYGVNLPGHGKVIEYLRIHDPKHLQALKESGVVRD